MTRRHRTPWAKPDAPCESGDCRAGSSFCVATVHPASNAVGEPEWAQYQGSYTSDGVWGTATLAMQRTETFVEEWQFKNEYSGKPERSRRQHMARGATKGETGIDTKHRLDIFQGIGRIRPRPSTRKPWSQRNGVTGASPPLEIDAGSDIVFRKVSMARWLHTAQNDVTGNRAVGELARRTTLQACAVKSGYYLPLWSSGSISGES